MCLPSFGTFLFCLFLISVSDPSPLVCRWIHKKYPKITSPVIEEEEQVDTDGQVIPVDIAGPNPNGIECDNLYLDMNGFCIFSPCIYTFIKRELIAA